MELELREQLLDSDHGLWIAWFVYELDDNPDNFERARNAVHWQIRDGLIEVLYKCGDAKRVLNEWEVISVLAEEDNWHKLDTESFYFLHLTNEGAKLI